MRGAGSMSKIMIVDDEWAEREGMKYLILQKRFI